MSFRFTRLIALSITLIAFFTAGVSWAGGDEKIETLQEHLDHWRTDDVRDQLAPLLKASPDDLSLRYIEARLLFLEGRYQDALGKLDGLIGDFGEVVPDRLLSMRGLVLDTYNALATFDEIVSPDGRFLIRFTGRDRLLVPYVLDVLDRADEALSKDFNFKPRGQVLVEIYPEIKYLAAVSPLTEEDIETSGTIALCKYNRLMFTSPRALVRGYGWKDTLSHEFVHYYLTKKSGHTVPIWLHEGIAKFEESRWRQEPGDVLEPPQEDLLARSLAEDKLITFQQMHPSMAKLPSQKAAGLAFAQVHTVIGFLHRKKGYEGLNGLVESLGRGRGMDSALKSVYGVDLDGLWTIWRNDLQNKGLRTFPGLVQQSLKFRRPGDPETEDDSGLEFTDIEEKRAKDFAHIGELLRARGRHDAAIIEYRKAVKISGDGNPMIQNGLAASILASGDAGQIPTILERVSGYYPGFLRTHLNLGEAFLKVGDNDKAVDAFEAAIGINPFHPRPHAALVSLYTRSGHNKKADREKAALEILK